MHQSPWARAYKDSGWYVMVGATHTTSGEFVVYDWYPNAGKTFQQSWAPPMKLKIDNQPRRNFVSGSAREGKIHLGALPAAPSIRDALGLPCFLGEWARRLCVVDSQTRPFARSTSQT